MEADIAAMRASITTSPTGTITYSTVCNHLSTSVSQLPEFISKGRNVSFVETQDETSLSCYTKDGTLIIDQFLPDWQSYPDGVKKKILSERRRLGIQLGRGGHHNQTGNSKLNKLKKDNEKFKRKIKALQKLNPSADQDDDQSDNSDVDREPIDAGDQFGGKASKKKN